MDYNSGIIVYDDIEHKVLDNSENTMIFYDNNGNAEKFTSVKDWTSQVITKKEEVAKLLT